jgi:hypothetical protein
MNPRKERTTMEKATFVFHYRRAGREGQERRRLDPEQIDRTMDSLRRQGCTDLWWEEVEGDAEEMRGSRP